VQKLCAYKNSVVSYTRFGSGKQVLVAFHGYGQSSLDYLYFEDVLSNRFTVIAIDFFFHGQSVWREAEDFTETDMRDIVLAIAHQEHLVARKFSICSFSMGARMARALVRTFPERIDQLILLSPPTFAFNHFLNFSTGTYVGIRLFQYTLKHHERLLSWVKRLNKWHILNRSVYIFSSKFIAHPERLQNVYNTWYAQRQLRTHFKTFAALINQFEIEVILIVGKADAITPPAKMIAYIRKLKHRKVFIIRQKHELKTPETKCVLEKLFS
jgi:pimeloyl-ACP methyl ester carboxylesterase